MSLIPDYHRERMDASSVGEAHDVFPCPQTPGYGCDCAVGVMVGRSGDGAACFEVSGQTMTDTLLPRSHPLNHQMASLREMSLGSTTALSYSTSGWVR